jgi:glycogen debranching enzyme
LSLGELRRELLADLDRLRDLAGYLRAGWPRYNTLFGRDSLISAWQTLGIDPSIARATLLVLAKFQGHSIDDASEEEPGKILHEYRFEPAAQAELPGWKFPYYGSVDSTPLFLVVASAYLARTGDRALLSTLWPAIERAHAWMTKFGDIDGDGFLEYRSRNPRALFHQGWKDGSEDHLKISPPVALVEVQGYAIMAHRGFADMAEKSEAAAGAARARELADGLQSALARAFWWAKEGTFYLALDGAKRPRAAVTSNPGHLLVTGVLERPVARSLVGRLFRKDLWTPYGIRTHASSEPDFNPYGYHTGTVWPHDNWIIYKGLQAMGFRQEAGRVREALLNAREELGKLPELYAVVDDSIVDLSEAPVAGTQANPVQAWASAGLLEMIDQTERSSP